MGLSKKRQRELNRLKSQAEELWDDQKVVLEHANKVVRDARRQAAAFAREEVSPRVRSVASSTRGKLVGDVFPAVSSALGSALAAVEVAKNKQLREALVQVSRAGRKVGEKVGIVKPPSQGPGRYILIGLAVVTAVAVAYAAWQTLRADDDLWIDDQATPLDEPGMEAAF